MTIHGIEKDIKVSGLYAQIYELEKEVPHSVYAFRVDHSCQMAAQNFPCIHLLGAASETSDEEVRFLGNLRDVADDKDTMIVIHCPNDLLITLQEAQKLGYQIRPLNNGHSLALPPKSIREMEARASAGKPVNTAMN